MKFNKILGSLALTALVGASLSSCSNDLDDFSVNNTTKASLVNKAPKIKAYSGNHLWGQADDLATYAGLTRANGGNGTISWEEITTTALDLEAEAKYIDEKLPEGQQTIEGVDYDFIYYTDKAIEVEMFPVYMQTNKTQSYGIFYYDADGTYHEQLIWEGFTQWNRSSQEWSEEQNKNLDYLKGYKINIPANTTFGFYIAVCDYKPTDWSSEWNVQDKAYTSSHLNKEGYNSDASYKTKVRAITWYENGKTYLGFEDWTDFDYQDLVFTMNKEVSTIDASTFEPGTTPEPEDNCGTCGHPSHDPGQCEQCTPGQYPDCRPEVPEDNCELCDHPSHNPGQCPDCDKFQGCNKPGSITPGEDTGFTYPEGPEEKPNVEGNIRNEVEANLHGVEKNGEYLESHLSLHVRKATDVEVFIPVPRQYTCDADDMEIVLKHDVDFEYGNKFENEVYTTTYDINGNTVTLNVKFEDEGIRIWTDGINQDVIDYCWENYQDGITFEIWNYFNDPEVVGNLPNGAISLDELKYLLDKATIKFLDEEPDYYINAKKDEDNDCTVSIVEEQRNDFFDAKTGPHNNGSELNMIYENKTKSQNSTGSGS